MMKHAAGNPAFTDAERELINDLGPYFKLAHDHGQEDLFMKRVTTLWFFRWPLRLRDYLDHDFLEHDKKTKIKVFLFFFFFLHADGLTNCLENPQCFVVVFSYKHDDHQV